MKLQLDRGVLFVVLFLLGLGLVQVYSSSFIFAIESYGDGHYFFKRQLVFSALGFAGMLAFANAPWRFVERWGVLLWVIAGLGIAATFVPGLGIKAGGAMRWLKLPLGQRFEPGELLKISLPIVMAVIIARGYQVSWRRSAIRALIVLTPLAMLLRQPDFGTFAICAMVSFFVLFAYGLKWRYILAALVAAVPAFYFVVLNVPYRYARIKSFIDPWADPEAKGFQAIQSMLSFSSGGLWGVGLGQGQGKLFFLPEAHNDFTFAVLGEEMGFLGVVFVLLLYGFLIFRGLQITVRGHSRFDQALALGLTLTLGVTVFVNVGVVMGLLPPKGLSLPFLSYGGSSLVSTCLALGLLLNIERQTRAKPKKSFSGLKI